MVDQINHHLYRKRGFYYFSRRVPKALLDDYPKSRIVLALKTRHYRDALRQSQILSKRLNNSIQIKNTYPIGANKTHHLIINVSKKRVPIIKTSNQHLVVTI